MSLRHLVLILSSAALACGGATSTTTTGTTGTTGGTPPSGSLVPNASQNGAPGTPAPAIPDPNPPPTGGGSNRFEMGTFLGLYLVDPLPGEASVQGWVVVGLGAAGGGAPGEPPADTVVTLNGVPLVRDPPPTDQRYFHVDPAGTQPVVGSGGRMVLVASATDPSSGKAIQRALVLPCPSDVVVGSTPPAGAVLGPTVHISTTASLALNVGVVWAANFIPQVSLSGYDPVARARQDFASPVNIGPGPVDLDLAVPSTTASDYLIDLRWPGQAVLDGQSGGFCGLAKRWSYKH